MTVFQFLKQFVRFFESPQERCRQWLRSNPQYVRIMCVVHWGLPNGDGMAWIAAFSKQGDVAGCRQKISVKAGSDYLAPASELLKPLAQPAKIYVESFDRVFASELRTRDVIDGWSLLLLDVSLDKSREKFAMNPVEDCPWAVAERDLVRLLNDAPGP